jgi:pyruvate/2-oxoglutarate dehydrogenase complex dihydrolipoamide acyltransferase (E2) component
VSSSIRLQHAQTEFTSQELVSQQTNCRVLQIVIGGVSTCARVVGGYIEARDVLDLTVTIDHNIIDGAGGALWRQAA